MLIKLPVLLLLPELLEPLVHLPRPRHHRELGRDLLLEAVGAPPDGRHVGEPLGPPLHLINVVLFHALKAEAVVAAGPLGGDSIEKFQLEFWLENWL